MNNQNAYKREIGKGNDAIISHPELVSGSLHYNNEMLNQVQHDEERRNEMLNQVQHDVRKGFTLIELLVVVLIIGILAAVALPQYQKAVEKARLAGLFPAIEMLVNAQKRYFLENDKYATTFEELDLSFDGWTAPNKSTTKKHNFAGINVNARYNGNDITLYIGYPPYRYCVFALITKGKYYTGNGYGNGLGYCFNIVGRGWYYPDEQVFCMEQAPFKGEFCKLMGFNTYHGSGWGYYYKR